jgi:hypothetical protein
MLWAVVIVAVFIAGGMLWARDWNLRRRGKTAEQVRVASEANVSGYSGVRRLFVGLLLILGAVADYIDKGGATVRVVGLLLIGLATLSFGIGYLRRAHTLQKFVDSDQSQLKPSHAGRREL